MKKIAFIGRAFDDNWELDDPTGKSDEEFIKIIRKIEENILRLKEAQLGTGDLDGHHTELL